MALGERKKMGDKYRTAVTATVLTYIETAKQLGQDPLGMARLSTTGSVVLGAELSPKVGKSLTPKDSVYWVVVNPRTGKIGGYVRVAPDLSKWRRKLNSQLKSWGEKSAVKQLAKKRAITGAIVAAVTTAVVIAIVLTAGAAAGPAAAAAASQGGAGAGAAAAGGGISAGGAAAGATGGGASLTGLMQGFQALSAAAASGQDLAGQATAAEGAMPPDQAALVQQEADSLVNPALWQQPVFWIGVVGLTGLGAAAFALVSRD